MSLTSFLKEPDIRERFRQEFNKPISAVKKNLIAPPRSNRYSLVGMAFDYLLRFYVQRLNANATQRPWVAESGITSLAKQSLRAEYDLDTEELTFPEDTVLGKAHRVFHEAQMNYKRYLSSGRMTSGLMSSAIHLAQLEVIYRSGFVDENLGTASQEDVADLRKLMSIVRPEQFRAKKVCLLNPTFGSASLLVRGADADLLIDETLIDIKATQYPRVDREHFNQLIGYFVLHRLGRIGGIKPKPKVSRIGIYFARHAHLEIINLPEVINRKTFPAFVKWFEVRARRQYPRTIQQICRTAAKKRSVAHARNKSRCLL